MPCRLPEYHEELLPLTELVAESVKYSMKTKGLRVKGLARKLYEHPEFQGRNAEQFIGRVKNSGLPVTLPAKSIYGEKGIHWEAKYNNLRRVAILLHTLEYGLDNPIIIWFKEAYGKNFEYPPSNLKGTKRAD